MSENYCRIDMAKPVSSGIDERLATFVIDALGCAHEPVSRTDKPAPTDPSFYATFTASSAERESSSSWQAETTHCTVTVQCDQSFFPGDVNEPPHGTTYWRVAGTHRDRPVTLKLLTLHGDTWIQIEVEADPAEREAIFAKFRQTFAK